MLLPWRWGRAPLPASALAVAAAKGLALALDKPAIGVSTLAAMARNVAFADGLVVCAMDARRSQVYNATFFRRGRRTYPSDA